LGTSASSQSAAPTDGKGGRFAHRGHNEFAGLNLTTDQKAQIRTIHQEERTKMEALGKESHTRAEFRTQSMSIHKESREKIVNGVLTGEQRAQLQQREQQRQNRYRNPSSN
jgi:Spy/CpxP family protein refolding chaperone